MDSRGRRARRTPGLVEDGFEAQARGDMVRAPRWLPITSASYANGAENTRVGGGVNALRPSPRGGGDRAAIGGGVLGRRSELRPLAGYSPHRRLRRHLPHRGRIAASVIGRAGQLPAD